jgi:hypothetical protein
MLQYIYRTRPLDRQLKKMLISGKKGALAANQAEEIINIFCTHVDNFQILKRKQTKKGELRFDNCRKYDLGGGYRLVTLQDGDLLFLVYAGSHDECHLWLEKNKGTAFNTLSLISSSKILHVTPKAAKTSQNSATSPKSDPLEEELFSRLDEKTLRSVFKGLCEPK